MGSKFDVESALVSVGDLLSSSLNTYVTALNSEKADSITLALFDFNRTDSLHLQTLQTQVILANPFILYGLADDMIVDGLGPNTAKKVQVEIDIIVADAGNDSSIVRRLYRYQRALQDLLEANWDQVGRGAKLKILGKQPTPQFSLFDAANFYRGIGVGFEMVIV